MAITNTMPAEDESGAKTPANGLTEEQLKKMLALAGRHKDNPELLERWSEGIAEYRRQIQEELERELAEQEKK